MFSARRVRRGVVPAFVIVLLAGAPGASAQGVGVRTGGTMNPDQFYVGGQYEWGPIDDKIWLQPSVDFGFGDNAKLIAGHIDVVYRHSFSRRSPWTALAGAGPSINHYRVSGVSNTEMGVDLLGGVLHESGFFGEFRVGLADSPDLRFGVGYRFGASRSSSRPSRRR